VVFLCHGDPSCLPWLIDYRQKSPETIASGLVWNEADHREPEATATGPSGDSTVRNPLLAAGFFAP